MRPRCACPSTWARRPSASASTWSSPPWACRPAATPSLVRRSARQPMACRLDASGQALQAGDIRGGGVNSVELSLARILNQIAMLGMPDSLVDSQTACTRLLHPVCCCLSSRAAQLPAEACHTDCSLPSLSNKPCPSVAACLSTHLRLACGRLAHMLTC